MTGVSFLYFLYWVFRKMSLLMSPAAVNGGFPLIFFYNLIGNIGLSVYLSDVLKKYLISMACHKDKLLIFYLNKAGILVFTKFNICRFHYVLVLLSLHSFVCQLFDFIQQKEFLVEFFSVIDTF